MEGKLFEPLSHIGECHGERLDGCERVLEIQSVSIGIYSSKLHNLKRIHNMNIKLSNTFCRGDKKKIVNHFSKLEIGNKILDLKIIVAQ